MVDEYTQSEQMRISFTEKPFLIFILLSADEFLNDDSMERENVRRIFNLVEAMKEVRATTILQEVFCCIYGSGLKKEL
jgi:hypothetical protein